MDNDLLRIFEVGKSYTIQQIMKLTGKSYKPVYFSLMKLAKEGYLLRKRSSWKHFFALNLQNPIVLKNLEIRDAINARRLLDENPSVENILRECESLPLLCAVLINHGLLIVLPEKNGDEEEIRKVCNRYGMKVAISSSTVFRKLLRSSLGKQILAGVPVFGFEYWNRTILEAR
jgi:hypothetical protein